MRTLADRVGLPQPLEKLVVELVHGDDSEVVHEKALRVRTGSSDPWVLDATLQVEIAVKRRLLRGCAGKTAAASLQADGCLRDRVTERTTRLGEFDEAAIEGDNVLGLVMQVTLDGPLVGHAAEATRPASGEERVGCGGVLSLE
jgi:hypothetical protein